MFSGFGKLLKAVKDKIAKYEMKKRQVGWRWVNHVKQFFGLIGHTHTHTQKHAQHTRRNRHIHRTHTHTHTAQKHIHTDAHTRRHTCKGTHTHNILTHPTTHTIRELTFFLNAKTNTKIIS